MDCGGGLAKNEKLQGYLRQLLNQHVFLESYNARDRHSQLDWGS